MCVVAWGRREGRAEKVLLMCGLCRRVKLVSKDVDSYEGSHITWALLIQPVISRYKKSPRIDQLRVQGD